MKNLPRLLTVAEAEELTGLSLRHRIFANSENFNDLCVVRFGRSVRIDPEALATFIEERRGRAPTLRREPQNRDGASLTRMPDAGYRNGIHSKP